MHKIFSFLILINVWVKCNCQESTIIDSSEKRFLSPFGHRDPNLKFEEFSITASDGNLYTLDSFKNKITFVNFWYAGCPPCIAELPSLNNLYNRFKDNKYFQFLSFTSETKESTLKVTQKYRLPYPILFIEREKIHTLMFNLGFPISLIIDTNGEIRFLVCGGFEDENKIAERIDITYSKEIKKLLDEKGY